MVECEKIIRNAISGNKYDQAYLEARKIKATLSDNEYYNLIKYCIKLNSIKVIACMLDTLVGAGDFRAYKSSVEIIEKVSKDYYQEIIAISRNGKINRINEMINKWVCVDYREVTKKRKDAFLCQFRYSKPLSEDDLKWLRERMEPLPKDEKVELSLLINGLIHSLRERGGKVSKGEIEIWVNTVLLPEFKRQSEIDEVFRGVFRIADPIRDSSPNHKDACFELLNMLRCEDIWGIKTFAFRVMEAFEEADERLKWFKLYQRYTTESKSKKATSGFKLLKKYLDKGANGHMAWWEKIKLEEMVKESPIKKMANAL